MNRVLYLVALTLPLMAKFLEDLKVAKAGALVKAGAALAALSAGIDQLIAFLREAQSILGSLG